MTKAAPKKSDSSANIGFEAKLWLAADKLRNNMDAAEYKHVVLGLIFLKYISDAFEEMRAKLVEGKGDYAGADPEDADEYRAENVFWVPKEARWSQLMAAAKQPTIGKVVDDAMVALERDNPRLKGVLPKDYARPALDKHRLGELIDLISTITLLPSPAGGITSDLAGVSGQPSRMASSSIRGAGGEGVRRDRRKETLFIVTRKLGTLIDRVHRELTDEDIARIASTYHAWRGDKIPLTPPLPKGEAGGSPLSIPPFEKGGLGGIYQDTPGFCKSATTAEIATHGYRRTALEGGELLMTLVGNVGQCAVVPPRMAGWNTARAVAVMRLIDQTDVHFVQQCLLSRPLQHLMDVWCNTTVQATLNLKEIRQLPLPWPPKPSRDAIAAIGKALDDKIELNRRMPRNIKQYIEGFDGALTSDEFASAKFAYRVIFVPKTTNHPNQADQAITFVKADSELAKSVNATYAVIRETERPKWLPSQIVAKVKSDGFPKFGMAQHSDLWKSSDARNPAKGYGVQVAKTWYWYDTWLAFVRKHCADNSGVYR